MKRLVGCALLIFGFAAPELFGQQLSAAALASPAKPQRRAAKDSAKAAAKPKEKGDEREPVKDALGENGVPKGQPIITEIFADEAFFDSANHMGIFTGHVIVNDPRFNVQSDKLTVYLSKSAMAAQSEEPKQPAEGQQPGGPSQALEKAVAEGNVGVVRERPDEKGGPPVRTVGRGDIAIYTTGDGNVELRGTPRVQSGMNTHVATNPDTVMILQGDGQLFTKGPSRTEIKQPPKTEAAPTAAPAKP
ncbi:MAG: LptA/OstA family protein [Chthoniobacterales bacterium]